MNIAELFVNLGIKGSEKTVGALSNVRKGLGELTSTSIEAKAAILAAVYGFERLMSASGQMGTNLANFNALTGISTNRLQEYQYAARQAGVSNEEMAGSLKSVQTAMSAVTRGEGAPAGMKFISGFVGGFDSDKIKNIDYVMQKLQMFANNPNIEAAQKRWALSSFGLGESTVAALNRNMFRPDLMKNAPKYGTKEISSLNQAAIAWSNLGTKIEMAFGHFNAKHGAQLVTDFSMIVTKVVSLTEAFLRLAESLKFFKGLGKIFEGWTSMLGVDAEIIGNVVNNKKGILTGIKEESSDVAEGMGLAFKGLVETIIESITPNGLPAVGEDQFKITPAMPNATPGTMNQNNNVNQTFNFNDNGKDHKKIGDSVKKAVSDAYRQSHALVQGA